MPEQLDLAQGAETEHGVVEGRDALDCDLATGRYVHRRAGNETLSAWASKYAADRTHHTIPYAPSPADRVKRKQLETIRISCAESQSCAADSGTYELLHVVV